MKKILLAVSALVLGFAANAQNVGYSATGILDDFNSATEYENVYWYPVTGSGADTVYTLTRTGTVLEVAADAADPTYSTFGISFGEDATTGAVNTIDMSQAATSTVSFTVTNNHATEPAILTMNVTDVNGLAAEIQNDTLSDTGTKEANKFEVSVPANSTQTVTYDFAGAYRATWPCADYPTDCPVLHSDVDMSQIASVSFYINGGAGTAAAPALTPFTGTIVLENVEIGDFTTNTKASKVASSNIYPNPASVDATVKLSLETSANVNVVVTDLMGRVVTEVYNGTTASVSETINVSGLAKGTYTVTYFVDGAAAKSELLLVK